MKFVLVAGTHGYRGGEAAGWYCPGSPFAEFCGKSGEVVFESRKDGSHDAFVWDTEIGGIWGKMGRVGWEAWGRSLYQYCVPRACPSARIPPDELTVVSHSHGRQVVLYALAHGLQLKHWVDVCGPVRFDLREVQSLGRANIHGSHVHIYSDANDRWQILGQLFDGGIAIPFTRHAREDPMADRNEFIPGGHSVAVSTPSLFHEWWNLPVGLPSLKTTQL